MRMFIKKNFSIRGSNDHDEKITMFSSQLAAKRGMKEERREREESSTISSSNLSNSIAL